MTLPVVSVIIPCYNAGAFLQRTLESVCAQTYTNLQVIVVNDGSTDDSARIINAYTDVRKICFSKPNSGVCDSRNIGLELSKGKYVLFLDADDILSPDFVEKRVALMESNQELGICAGKTIKIDEKENFLPGELRGAGINMLTETLLYDQKISTCPSNYLIRKSVLEEYNIRFNTNLYSSADRMFLVEISNYTRAGFIEKGGELYYRVHAGSMSNNLTPALVKDNARYLKELARKKLIPKVQGKEFRFKNNYIISGSYFRLKEYALAVNYSCRAFINAPFMFLVRITKLRK